MFNTEINHAQQLLKGRRACFEEMEMVQYTEAVRSEPLTYA